jgi:RimJ/RimL family protein N-acetyltransferase
MLKKRTRKCEYAAVFEVVEEQLETAALKLRYYLAPWDESTVGAPVAVLSTVEVRQATAASDDFEAFRLWCGRQRVALVSCKLQHHRLKDSAFLESQGFRFIELNYRPEATDLRAMRLEDTGPLSVELATANDEDLIAQMAGEIFDASRFHHDPMIDGRIGDFRYRRWVNNAFRNPKQSVVKCLHEGRIVAFFVVECPEPDRRFWSLVGLAPGLAGRGMGTRVWRTLLRWHRDQGVRQVSTSVSSLNTPVQNLYVKLGFRFPPPEMTFHFCPLGPIRAAG